MRERDKENEKERVREKKKEKERAREIKKKKRKERKTRKKCERNRKTEGREVMVPPRTFLLQNLPNNVVIIWEDFGLSGLTKIVRF